MLADHLQKNKERIPKFKETGDSQYMSQVKLNKVCFEHEMAYEDLKDLRRRTASNKILCDNAFNMAKKSKCDGYQRGLASMVHTFFENKSVSVADKSASSGAIQNENISNKELAEELHKPIIKNSRKENYNHLIILLCN